MTARIDLSRFERPTISGLVLTVDEAHEAMLAWLASEHDYTVTRDASDPAYRLTRLVAAREVLVRQSVADAMAETSLAYASRATLEQLGATYYSILPLPGEGTDDYRLRLASAVERYAVGLSGPWYESVARGVAGVKDARVTNPAPGDVTIYLLADESLLDAMGDPLYVDGIPTAALIDAVAGVVTAEDTRQQTDVVTVTACTRQLYDVSVTLTVLSEPDSSTVRAVALAALERLAARTDVLGGSLTEALVAGAAVNIDATASATIVITTIDSGGVEAAVNAIDGMDSVAPQHRTLEVALA